jgi:hypothetical protein
MYHVIPLRTDSTTPLRLDSAAAAFAFARLLAEYARQDVGVLCDDEPIGRVSNTAQIVERHELFFENPTPTAITRQLAELREPGQIPWTWTFLTLGNSALIRTSYQRARDRRQLGGRHGIAFSRVLISSRLAGLSAAFIAATWRRQATLLPMMLAEALVLAEQLIYLTSPEMGASEKRGYAAILETFEEMSQPSEISPPYGIGGEALRLAKARIETGLRSDRPSAIRDFEDSRAMIKWNIESSERCTEGKHFARELFGHMWASGCHTLDFSELMAHYGAWVADGLGVPKEPDRAAEDDALLAELRRRRNPLEAPEARSNLHAVLFDNKADAEEGDE